MAASAKQQAPALTKTVENLINNGTFNPIIEKCEGCERIVSVNENKYCKSYASPEAKWKIGICNYASHVRPEIQTAKTRVNPLKASKRAMAKAK